jgi:hypothetical protein
METEKVEVTLVTSDYYGRYGVIQKVTQKKFKIRFWDTGEETYLWQTSVRIVRNGGGPNDESNSGGQSSNGRKHGGGGNDADGNDNDGHRRDSKKTRTVKRAKVSQVNQMLQSMENAAAGDVTQDEWDSIVLRIGRLFV